MSPCVCFKGCQEIVTYHGLDASRNGKPDGSELVMCKWCEGLISRTPTTRERLHSEGRLPWQSWPDRTGTHAVPLEDLDKFAAAFAALPGDFPITMDGDDIGPTLVGELSGTPLDDGGLGTAY